MRYTNQVSNDRFVRNENLAFLGISVRLSQSIDMYVQMEKVANPTREVRTVVRGMDNTYTLLALGLYNKVLKRTA